MKNLLSNLFSKGFTKLDFKVLNDLEIQHVKKILLNLKNKHINQSCIDTGITLPILGKDLELDLYIEKIFSSPKILDLLENTLGNKFVMRRPLVRFSGKKDTGLYIHQDEFGQTGLFFLVDDQPAGATIVMKGSHLIPYKKQLVNFLSWNSEKFLNFTKFFLTSIKGKSGDSFIWFQNIFHGRKPSEGGERITIFFTFFPVYNEDNKNEYIKNKLKNEINELIPNFNQLNLPNVKKIMNPSNLDNNPTPIKQENYSIPLFSKITSFNLFQKSIHFYLALIKILILEIFFSPNYLRRFLKKILNK